MIDITEHENNNHIDQYYQILRALVTETASNTYTEAEFATGVPRSQGKNKTTVMNIIKLIMQYRPGDSFDNADTISVHIADRSHPSGVNMGVAGVVWSDLLKYQLATNGARYNEYTKVVDLTDGKGKGYLYAKQKIFLAVQGVDLTDPQTFVAAICYTLVDIPSVEFIGIIET